MRALLALVVVIALSTMGCGSKDKVKKVEKTTPEKPARTGAREPPKTGSADDPGSQVSERQAGQEEEHPAASPDAVHALTGGVDAGEADTIPNSSARVKDGAEVTPKPIEPPHATDVQPGVAPADLEPPPNPDRIIATELIPGRFDAATLERMAKTLDEISVTYIPGPAFADPSKDPAEYSRQRKTLADLLAGHLKVAQVLHEGSLSELPGPMVAVVVEASTLWRDIDGYRQKLYKHIAGDQRNPEGDKWRPVLLNDLTRRRGLCLEIARASHKTMVELATHGSDELRLAILQEMLEQREAMGDYLEALCSMQPEGSVKETMQQALKSGGLSCSLPPDELVRKLALVLGQPEKRADLLAPSAGAGDALGGAVIPGDSKAKKAPSKQTDAYGSGSGKLAEKKKKKKKAKSVHVSIRFDIKGRLDRTVVKRRARSRLGDFKSCVKDTGGDASGKISLSAIVGPSGKVLKASVSGSPAGLKTAAGCMKKRLAAWTVPAPMAGGSTEVSVNLRVR